MYAHGSAEDATNSYTCRADGGIAISKRRVEALGVEAFMDFMEHARVRPIQGSSNSSLTKVSSDLRLAETRLETLTRDHYVKGLVPDAVFRSTYQELNEVIDRLQLSADSLAGAEVSSRGALVPGDREALERWWATASISYRRQALALAISTIVVLPPNRHGKAVFDPGRVEINWSSEVYEQAPIPSRQHRRWKYAVYERWERESDRRERMTRDSRRKARLAGSGSRATKGQ
jgi:hypothetical protein